MRWLNLNFSLIMFHFIIKWFLEQDLHSYRDPTKLCQYNNIYTTRGAFFLLLVSSGFSCTNECLKLYGLPLEFLKMFCLQTAQNTHEWIYLRWSLNVTCFMDLLLESYKYDKIKVRIIVTNYQIVSQIFKFSDT